jgi:hypothetical protein
MQDQNAIVVFRKFDSAIDANIAKSKLDAHGIPCFLTEENMANLYPGASNLMNFSVRLHLFDHDAERARQIIYDKFGQNDDVETQCVQCGSRNLERDFPKNLTEKFASSLRYVFFGIFFPNKKVFRCCDCGFEFEGD